MNARRMLFLPGLFVMAISGLAAEKEVTLLGVLSGSAGSDVAVIEVRTPEMSQPRMMRINIQGTNYTVETPPKPPDDLILRAGQSMEGVEVLDVQASKRTVNLTVEGEKRTLVLEADREHPTTNTSDTAASTVIHFRSLPLGCAISLYPDFKKRTVLIHPRLENPTFSVNVRVRTEQEAAAVFEKLFNEQEIATIPDGEHFVLMAPFALTNKIAPRAASFTATNQLLFPALSINFRAAPIDLVFSAYADYVQKNLIRSPNGNCCDLITLIQVTPLSKEEIIYALETLFEWNRFRVVPEGAKDLKVERLPADS